MKMSTLGASGVISSPTSTVIPRLPDSVLKKSMMKPLYLTLCLFIRPSLAGVRHELFLAVFAEERVGCLLAFGMPSVVLEVAVIFAGFVNVLFAFQDFLRTPDAAVFLACHWFGFR